MKKICFIFITFILYISINLIEVPLAAAESNTYITFHYHRYDNDYTNWDIWVWQYLPIAKEGKAVALTDSDEFGRIARINLSDISGYSSTNPPSRLGFIIKKGNWTDREVGGDRFINVNGSDIHVYVIEGDVNVYFNRDEADISPKILNASFKDFKTITFTTTNAGSFTIDTIVVKKQGNPIEVTNVSGNSTKGTIALKDKIDLTKEYTLEITGFSNEKRIDKANMYDSTEFVTEYTYDEDNLGATYTNNYTDFKVWSPLATDVSLVLYSTGDYRNGSVLDGTRPTDLLSVYPMNRSELGTWSVRINQDLDKVYYTYRVNHGDIVYEATDPYARAVGVNGHRGMVINLSTTNPSVWNNDKPPLENLESSIIYEIHIRDLSIHSSSNTTNKGKYLGLTENNTSYKGVSTGVSHLKELGITHLHILPAFDYRSIDELMPNNDFNWGYDPLNYNAPEGTYSTDPYLGEVRIKEFKQMVENLHENGIRVVMDVVYNHLGDAGTSSFQKLVPNYYFRTNQNGEFTNGSGVGNETASERAMMRKFIVDSVKYWAKEYHIDGFRFDLMAVHDIETMNEVRRVLNDINPSIIVYGEGWTGGTSALPLEQQATKDKVYMMPQIGVFNDVFRDGVKGSVWSDTDKGFIQGAGKSSDVMFGIVGGISHLETRPGWASDPEQIINYVEAHDNNTLWDKLTLSVGSLDKQTRVNMAKQAGAIVLTSQGIPFLHAGQDFLRSKPYKGGYSHNSYNLPDYVNQLRYDYKAENIAVFDYYKGLISLRKAHPAFRMTTAEDIKNKLSFIDTKNPNVIAYTIIGAPNDDWNNIFVGFNGSDKTVTVNLREEGRYNIVVDKDSAGTKTIRSITGKTIAIAPHESIVAYKEEVKKANYLPVIVGLLGVGAIGAMLILLRRKR